MFILILSLIFALLVAIFAVQNSAPVSIHFLWTLTEVPLVLVILGSALAGALIVFLLALWREFRYRRKKTQENKTVDDKNGDSPIKLTQDADSLNGSKSEQTDQEKSITEKDDKN